MEEKKDTPNGYQAIYNRMEDFQWSEQEGVADLIKAWISAKEEMGSIVELDCTNPHFGNRFASLEATLAKINPVFAKHGLALIQFPTGSHLVNILVHTSGQQMRCRYAMAPTKRDPQALGSALTYARRYCAQAIAGVSGGQDDDAEASMRGDNSSSSGGNGGNTSDRHLKIEEVAQKFIKSANWKNAKEYGNALEKNWDSLMKGAKNLNERKSLAQLLNDHKSQLGGSTIATAGGDL